MTEKETKGENALARGGMSSAAFSAALRRIAAPHRVMPGFLLALIILLFAGWVSYQSIDDLVRNVEAVKHSHRVLDRLQVLMQEVRDAEAGERGFVISAREEAFADYQAAERKIPKLLSDLELLVTDNPHQLERLRVLEARLDEALLFLHSVTDTARIEGMPAARALVNDGTGDALIEDLRAAASLFEREERARLTERQQQARESATTTRRNVTGAGLAALSLLLIAGIIVRRDSRERLRAAAEVTEVNERLASAAARAEERSVEIARLADLSQLLQACQEPAEAYRVLERALPALVHRPGALFILSPSANVLELMASWGEVSGYDRVFGPHDCWSLRRSRTHESLLGGSGPVCPHLAGKGQAPSTCIPLMAQGDTLGVLMLAGTWSPADDADRHQLVTATAEQVALALANLRLRDTLKIQSIRDPLTGLFNRRFLEESLDRECRRALRAARPLSLIMFDVDHFKRFNDTFGHDAGDLVLREIGSLLRAMFRGEDVACRFGGEEFALVLSDTGLEQAVIRAEQLREQAHQLLITYRRQAVGAITLSLGVAVLPEHGASGDALVRAADRALYAAKHGGRDRVAVAEYVEEDPGQVVAE